MNNYLDRIPTYTEKSTSYYTLLKSLHNYIVNTGIVPVQNFMMSMQTIQKMLTDSVIDKYNNIAKMILNRLDGSLRYYPDRQYLTSDEYIYLYFNAITSIISFRHNIADKISLMEQLKLIFPNGSIVINDGGIDARGDNSKIMTIDVFITLNSVADISGIFAMYYVPNINGVGITIKIASSDTLIMTPLRENTNIEYSSDNTDTQQGYVVTYSVSGNDITFTPDDTKVSNILQYINSPECRNKSTALATKRLISPKSTDIAEYAQVTKTTSEKYPDITDSGRSLQGK